VEHRIERHDAICPEHSLIPLEVGVHLGDDPRQLDLHPFLSQAFRQVGVMSDSLAGRPARYCSRQNGVSIRKKFEHFAAVRGGISVLLLQMNALRSW